MFIDLNGFIVNTNFLEILVNEEGEYYCYIGGERYSLTKEHYNKLKLAVLPRNRKTRDIKLKNQDLFNKLHTLTGGKGEVIYNQDREKKLNALMTKYNMSEKQLVIAATNIGKDAFLQGDNQNKKRYGDIDYLLRPDKAVKWAEATPTNKKRGMFQ